MDDQDGVVYGGVDTHQDVHVCAVIDQVGRLLGTCAFATTDAGLAAAEAWLASHGRLVAVGVEGTGSYGMGLTWVLTHAGHTVIEVSRPNRAMRRARGKSDTVDAEAAARAAASGCATAVPKSHDGIVEAIRVTMVAYRSSRETAEQAQARMRSVILTAPESLRARLSGLSAHAQALAASRLRPGTDRTDPVTATKATLALLGRQYLDAARDRNHLEATLEALTTAANPGLRQLPGVGAITAAQLLITAGDNPERLHSEAAFAALCGVAPIPASSGKTTAVRLSRGGDRQANSALFLIAHNRLVHGHAPTREYYERRTAQGKSRKSILRCLKRYLAREIYSHLVRPRPAVRTDDLPARRRALGATQQVVADALGVSSQTICRLEKGTNHNADLATRYRAWIHANELLNTA